jgi:hypothetical protein
MRKRGQNLRHQLTGRPDTGEGARNHLVAITLLI